MLFKLMLLLRLEPLSLSPAIITYIWQSSLLLVVSIAGFAVKGSW
jgi:hypothetical protein